MNQSLQQTTFLTVFGSKSRDKESKQLFLDRNRDSFIPKREILKTFRSQQKCSCKQYFSLSVYPAQWPPSYFIVIGKLCMVIVRQEKPCSVCIFGQTSQVWFQHWKKLLSYSQPKMQKLPSFTSEPSALGALPGTKAISLHCSMDRNTAPGRREVSLGYQLSQQQQETLHSLGVLLKPCQSTQENLAGILKAQGQQTTAEFCPTPPLPAPSLAPAALYEQSRLQKKPHKTQNN